MIPKPNKLNNEITSYRSIWLLPVISKINCLSGGIPKRVKKKKNTFLTKIKQDKLTEKHFIQLQTFNESY